MKAEETKRDIAVSETAEKQHSAEKQTAADLAEAEQAARKALSDMNLIDDFLFGSVVTYPEIGEQFVSRLLKTILGRKVKHLSVTAQKVFYGADSGLHGARLDVYLDPEIEEGIEGNATVYDIEAESESKSSERHTLPRRTRFYHGKIAARSLKSGEDYEELKDAVVIMIMPFDPFGLKRMVYTIKNSCVEEPEMEYEDGASTIFLYTKGTVGIPNEALRQMLHYMENTTYENAVNEELREIHRMVETVRNDKKVGRIHMRMMKDLIRQSEKITQQSEKITQQSEKITQQSEKITQLEDEKTQLKDENAKQAEEIRRLKEELSRRG